uniref:Amine oxidase domain-containing protein n=1 Tax=Spongospora subterranea TaxID=70186 RepID=A0A0H5QHD4_9EUKA|eukprot:CRZ00751.1 hypothetical protein [Spongospora subterranea]
MARSSPQFRSPLPDPGMSSSAALELFARHTLSSFREPASRHVIVIGAGISGLVAGQRLKAYGYKVTILEARDRCGGRICTEPNGVDLSSNYVDYVSHNPLLQLIRDFEIALDLLIPIKANSSISCPPSSSPLSLSWLNGGHTTIISRLSSALDIQYNTVVRSVNHQISQVVVGISSGQHLYCDAVVSTIPPPVLTSGLVLFQPPLSSTQMHGLAQVKMATLNNVIVEFPHVFWPIDGDVFTTSSGAQFHSLARTAKLPILIHSTSDPTFESVDVDRAVSIVMSHLASDFTGALPEPVSAIRTAWLADEFSFGAYPINSSLPVNGPMWWERTQIRSPLFFAGDACTRENQGNVQSAVSSGIVTSRLVHEFLGRSLMTLLAAPPPPLSVASNAASVLPLSLDSNSVSSPVPELSPSIFFQNSPTKFFPVSTPAPPSPPIIVSAAPPPSSTSSSLVAPAKFVDELPSDIFEPVDGYVSEASSRRHDPNLVHDRPHLSRAEKMIYKFIRHSVDKYETTLSTKQRKSIVRRATARVLAEWREKGSPDEYLNKGRKVRIINLVKKYAKQSSGPTG